MPVNAAPRNIIRSFAMLIFNGIPMILAMHAMILRVIGLREVSDAAERYVLAGGALCAFVGAAAAYALLQDKPSKHPALLQAVAAVMAPLATLLLVFALFVV